MLKVGLTGGIACGKSFVLKEFQALGAHCIDADEISYQAILPGKPAYQEILNQFGRNLLEFDGSIDRKKLGSIVFSNEEQRQKLNKIVHPHVLCEVHQWLEKLQRNPTSAPKVAIVDAALMVETGSYRKYDCVVVVSCSPQQQLSRLIARENLSRQEAQDRIGSQMPITQKIHFAQFVIDNSGSRTQARIKTRKVFQHLLKLDR